MDRPGQPDRPREACGVMGVHGHPEAANIAYLGLYALQHREQMPALSCPRCCRA